MPNPMFNNSSAPNGQTAPNNPLNDPHKRYNRTHNTFNYGRVAFNTLRYADITPFEVVEGVEGDRLPFGSRHEIRTHTLKSPLMSDVFMKKTYFQIDMKALLPINWEKIYTNPTQGSDVPDDAYCFIPMFIDKLRSTIAIVNDGVGKSTNLIKYILFLESILSNGSLLSSLGYHFGSTVYCFDSGSRISFDKAFDKLFLAFVDHGYAYNLQLADGRQFFIGDDASSQTSDVNRIINWSQALDLIRHNDVNYIGFADVGESYELSGFSEEDYISVTAFLQSIRFNTIDAYSMPLNIARVAGYQLICSQFYTNDKIDSIYTSRLWLDNMRSLYINAYGAALPTFSYNGVRTEYDVLSAKCVSDMLDFGNIDFTEASSFDERFAYFMNLFGYRSSLRYGDYFTGARPFPLAVGDVTADVGDSGVSAIDVTRSIMMQRFLNSVNRVGRRFSDYVSGVMNGVAPPDAEEPRYLASVTSKVSGFEVENTAQDQGNIVTILKSADSNFIYEVEVGTPCLIYGLATFEVPRVYSRTIDRFNFHSNRFEWFNKFMQYIGDQDIYRDERDGAFDNQLPFAYTGRYMEYKQRYPIAAGGFVENLPGYAFITDNDESYSGDNEETPYRNIVPSFIRSSNIEFDRFYSSLTGYSLASYFHFILKFTNDLNARREMDYSPSIL